MAPITNSHNKLHFNVVFPSNLFLSNYGSEVSSLEVKFADNLDFQTISMGQILPVSYPIEGEYTWTYKLSLANGQILYAKNKFSVTGDLEKYVDIDSQNQSVAPANNLTGSGYWKVQLENYQYFIPFPPMVVNKPKLTLYIKLREGQTQITKPFIVAEGFDSGHITAPRQEGGDNTIETFLKQNGMQNSNPSLRNYLMGNYDIIYVDWGIGTDYIQNNAELFKKAIRWVNEHKIGNAKNVVLGQSMGGLIARYALKDMEDHGENHDANLFISHDARHLGANTPLSIQFMLRNLSKSLLSSPIVAGINYVFSPVFTGGAPFSEVLTLADTPASRQMLINYANGSYNIDNSVHNNWQSTLKSKGYPQLTRNVAISNGSECGTDQNLQDLVTMHHSSKGWFIDFVGALIGGLTLDADQILLSLVPGKSRYYYDFDARPMTNLNESKQLYNGKIVYKKDILWIIPAQHTLLSGTVNQPTNVLPIDKYGGGKFRFPKESLPAFIGDHINVADFSFIPTPSALDYKFGNSALTEADYQKTYSPVDDKDDVPFANFVVEQVGSYFGENNSHINFSARNRQFILNQLSTSTEDQNKTLTTSYLCGSKVKIGGESLLCGNDNVTYTTGFAPSIQWSVLQGSNLIDITGSTNQPQISFTPKENAHGLVKLQAYLAGGGSSNTVIKKIWIGLPNVSLYQSPDDFTHAWVQSNDLNATLEDQGLIPSQVVWRRTTEPYTRTGFSYLITTTIPEFDVEVTATNACGSISFIDTVFYLPDCKNYLIVKNGDNHYDIINPCISNPTENRNLFGKGEGLQTIVVNIYGQEIINTSASSFDLGTQLPGTYYARIIKDGKIVHTQTLLKN